jgi:hypothetical protein
MLEVDEYSPLVIVIEKKDLLSSNLQPYLDTLNILVSSKENMLKYYESVDVSISGYDDTSLELFEIEEVRNFIHKLDKQFPFWLFFLSKQYSGLQMIAYCFLLPHLTDEAKAKYHPQQLADLLTNRWFGAMNQLFEYLELSEDENERLTNKILEYFFQQ